MNGGVGLRRDATMLVVMPSYTRPRVPKYKDGAELRHVKHLLWVLLTCVYQGQRSPEIKLRESRA